MNILAKLGLGTFVILGVLSGGYYVMDLKANEAAKFAIETFKKDFEATQINCQKVTPYFTG